MLKVYTSTIRHNSPDKVDITVKSGDKAFAPTWEIVMGHKQGRITSKQYTDVYKGLMMRSIIENRERWQSLLAQETVVLCCYCPPGAFCHRHILADMLVQMFGAVYMGEIK